MKVFFKLPCVAIAGILSFLSASCEKESGTAEVVAELSSDLTELDELNRFRSETRQLYNNRQFAKLEALADQLRSTKAKFRDGSWKLTQFYECLACRKDEPEEMWRLHEEIHREWEREFPKSTTARVATADFLTTYAWHARTDSYADQVTEEGWRLFHKRLADARTVLDQSKTLAPACPVWWQTYQTVALGQGWPREEYDALFEEARTFDPGYFVFDCLRSKFLLPRWHGKPGEWERVAEDEISLRGESGPEVYARVVSYQVHYCETVFSESKASWSRTREGYDRLRKNHPDSWELLNTYCRLACLAGDREQANKLFEEIGENKVPSCWRAKGKEFDRARTWAMAAR